MSQRYLGGVITANPTAPTSSAATGVWTLEQQFQNVANWPKSPDRISRSVRLRSSASANLSRTFTTPTSNIKWTWSGWVKRGAIGSSVTSGILGSALGGASTYFMASFNGDALEILQVTGGAVVARLTTTAVYRDPSAWYHVVMVWDSANATSSSRLLLYVNGVQATAFSTATYPSSSLACSFNQSGTNVIGYRNYAGDSYYDGYMTEINFIDGQALTPSSFGFTDGNGIWQPTSYAGTYGTNGFYLNFSDNSGATATTIGKDYSGNGNNWTPNNISVTAGTTYDSMLDSPTVSSTSSNYCTLNPLTAWRTVKPSNGNLSASGSSNFFATGTMALPSGKWYCEVQILGGTNEHNIGFVNLNSALLSSFPGTTTIRGSNAFSLYSFDGKFYDNGTASASLATFAANDIVMFAYDADNSKIYVGRNGTWLNSAVPASGTGAVSTTATAPLVVAGQYDFGNATGQEWNFGQRPFSYTPPTGFVALNTQNLPTPTISKGAGYMAATTYAGSPAVAGSVTGVGFQPDFVWVKARNAANGHVLVDSVRGVQKGLFSAATTAEVTSSEYLTSFNTDGFSYGISNAYSQTSMISWNWLAGGTAVSNTAGSITSSVSAGATQGFSVVTYTGNATSGATVGHGLGVQPAMIIGKNRSGAAQNWQVWHQSMGDNVMQLNLTNAQVASTSNSVFLVSGINSTVFQLGTNASINGSGTTQVAYCFAEVAGYSKFGSYTGNGSADGPFVFCGFRPRFIMIKRTDSAGNNWVILDTSRDTYNAAGLYLYPNLSAAEDDYRASTGPVDILSNGFKQRSTLTNVNASGGTYIFMAVAENPFNISRAR